MESRADRSWSTPDSFGVVEQRWDLPSWVSGEALAEIAADEALRAPFAALGEVVETKRICGSFALAANREHAGRAPNYRAPKPPSSPRQKPVGHDRPPAMTAKSFFEAFWQESEAAAKRWQSRSASWSGERPWWASGVARSASSPRALTELGLDLMASAADVRRAFRRRALVDHPDRGGTSERFRRLVELRDMALQEIAPTGS